MCFCSNVIIKSLLGIERLETGDVWKGRLWGILISLLKWKCEWVVTVIRSLPQKENMLCFTSYGFYFNGISLGNFRDCLLDDNSHFGVQQSLSVFQRNYYIIVDLPSTMIAFSYSLIWNNPQLYTGSTLEQASRNYQIKEKYKNWYQVW